MPSKTWYHGWKDWESRSRTTGNLQYWDTLTFGDLDVKWVLVVSHDAAAPQFFYSFPQREGKACDEQSRVMWVITKRFVEKCRCVFTESSHWFEMLRWGPYAWHETTDFKIRHLSNGDGALAMCEMMGDRIETNLTTLKSSIIIWRKSALSTELKVSFQTHDKGVHQAFEPLIIRSCMV